MSTQPGLGACLPTSVNLFILQIYNEVKDVEGIELSPTVCKIASMVTTHSIAACVLCDLLSAKYSVWDVTSS